MAKTITSVVAAAEKQKISPDEAAADMPQFEQYWHHQAQKLEDVCRQAQTFPNLFFTIAPAEWRFPLHGGMFGKADQDDLSTCQAWLTMHMHNCIGAILGDMLWKNKAQAADLGIAEIEHYTYRFEFQGRGTLHAHAVAWVKFNPGVSIEELSGRSGVGVQTSPLVRLLEEVFDCGAVDAQRGHSEHNLLRYVAGYVAKASDSLRFQKGDEARGTPAETSRWRQVYRLLCKRSPLEQEMAMYFAGLPMVESSFAGERMYPPIPGSTAVNKYRHTYMAYQERLSAVHPEHAQVQEVAEDGQVLRLRSFVEWCRLFRLHQYIKAGEDAWNYVVRERNTRGRGFGKKCAIAMTWPFELLDIYCGAYTASFLPCLEAELCPLPMSSSPRTRSTWQRCFVYMMGMWRLHWSPWWRSCAGAAWAKIGRQPLRRASAPELHCCKPWPPEEHDRRIGRLAPFEILLAGSGPRSNRQFWMQLPQASSRQMPRKRNLARAGHRQDGSAPGSG